MSHILFDVSLTVPAGQVVCLLGRNGAGFTVLLAEQNVRFTLDLSDYGYIIDNGRIRYQGTLAELTGNEEVKRLCGL